MAAVGLWQRQHPSDDQLQLVTSMLPVCAMGWKIALQAGREVKKARNWGAARCRTERVKIPPSPYRRPVCVLYVRARSRGRSSESRPLRPASSGRQQTMHAAAATKRTRCTAVTSLVTSHRRGIAEFARKSAKRSARRTCAIGNRCCRRRTRLHRRAAHALSAAPAAPNGATRVRVWPWQARRSRSSRSAPRRTPCHSSRARGTSSGVRPGVAGRRWRVPSGGSACRPAG